MAYATSNPPHCLVPGVGAGAAIWYYASTDVHTDVDGTDYFTDGEARGMKVGDIVLVVKTTATVGATLHSVSSISAAGAANLSPAILA
jgi:hypothetical protein